jgi:AdoMet-dependent heme synthase
MPESHEQSCLSRVETVPNLFGIEVTRLCNLRCPHCFTSSGAASHPGPELEALRKLTTDLVRVGVRKIAFSGGEPLLRKDLEALMHHGLAEGIQSFGIVTNGYLVNRQRAKSLARAGLSIAQVSVDGVDAIDHCAVRQCQRGDFYRALHAIRMFLEVGVTVDVATILTPRNCERAPEMALFCEAIGVRALRYCSFVPTGRAVSDEVKDRFTVRPQDADGFIRFMQQMASHPSAPIGIFIDHGIGPWHPSGEFRCDCGEGVAYCSSEGYLYPCPGLIFDEFKVGNVFETPLETLFNSPAMSRVRQIAKSQLHGMCNSCPHQGCSGGCRGAAYARAGDVLAAPSYCFLRTTERAGGA